MCNKENIILTVYLDKDNNLVEIKGLSFSFLQEECTPYQFVLKNPDFHTIKLAIVGLESNQYQDYCSAGEVIFDECYTQNQGSLDEIKDNGELYLFLCLKCSEIVSTYYEQYKDYKKKYSLNSKTLGWGQKEALIRYYLHKDVESIEDMAKYWSQIEFLEKIQVLQTANIPLKFQ